MSIHQTIANGLINDAISEFLADFPEAEIEDVRNGIADALTDLPITFSQARAEQDAA